MSACAACNWSPCACEFENARRKREQRRKQQQRPNSGAPEPVELSAFMVREHEPPKPLVPGLILQRTIHCIGGRPRGGKTPLLLQLGLSCAWGEPWCEGVAPSTKTGVLHLGMERGEQILQKQLRDQLAGRPLPENYYVQWSWPRLDQGGAEALDNWLSDHKEVGFVVIDPWALLRPRDGKKGGVDAYYEDYDDTGMLRDMKDRHGVAFLMSMHTNQNREPLDMAAAIYGNTGLTGAVDMVGVLYNKRKLAFEGTLIEPQVWKMSFQYPHWKLVDIEDGSDTTVIELGEKELHVLGVLRKLGPGKHPQSKVVNLCDPKVMSPKGTLESAKKNARRALERLAAAGKIEVENGMIRLADPDGQTDTP